MHRIYAMNYKEELNLRNLEENVNFSHHNQLIITYFVHSEKREQTFYLSQVKATVTGASLLLNVAILMFVKANIELSLMKCPEIHQCVFCGQTCFTPSS